MRTRNRTRAGFALGHSHCCSIIYLNSCDDLIKRVAFMNSFVCVLPYPGDGAVMSVCVLAIVEPSFVLPLPSLPKKAK